MERHKSAYRYFNLYFMDESRLGPITQNGKSLTAKRIKPVCPFQQAFKNLWLSGAFSPVNGEHFLLELPVCNSDCFQIWLNEFSELNPQEFKIIFLDNGAFHKAEKPVIPANIEPAFIPPYCPELNPAEKIWAFFKGKFTNRLCKTLDEVSDFIADTAMKLSYETVVKTCRYEYIDLAISDCF
ncbi:MAG: transposase [Tannerella sp.]|nr:transposase [Tannerella sp.]